VGDEAAQVKLLREAAGGEVAHHAALHRRRLDAGGVERCPARLDDDVAQALLLLAEIAGEVGPAGADEVDGIGHGFFSGVLESPGSTPPAAAAHGGAAAGEGRLHWSFDHSVKTNHRPPCRPGPQGRPAPLPEGAATGLCYI